MALKDEEPRSAKLGRRKTNSKECVGYRKPFAEWSDLRLELRKTRDIYISRYGVCRDKAAPGSYFQGSSN